MNLKAEEKDIIEEMKNIRFLSKGIEEIERYEELNQQIRKYNDIECIPELCEIMEDDVDNCSVVEEVLETILILVINNDSEKAIQNVIEGTVRMKNHGDSWARILHTQLLRNKDLRETYIRCVKMSENTKKNAIIEVLNVIKDKKKIKDIDIAEIIQNII